MKDLKAKWEGIVVQRRKLQALPRGMMVRETQDQSGRTTREYLWQASYVNGRAEEAIQAAQKIDPKVMDSLEGKLAQELARRPNKKRANKAASLLKRKSSMKGLTREDRARQYSLSMAMGQFLFRRQEYADAIASYQTAHEQATILQNSDLVFLSMFDLGAAYGMSGNYDEAYGLCERAVELRPKDAEAHCNLGVALGRKGDNEGAIAEFREAIRLDQNYAKAHYDLGLALGQKRDTEGEIAQYREVIRLKPDYAEAHYNLGVSLAEKGDMEGETAAYREAIRLKPDYAEAHSNLGVVLREEGDVEGAIAAYRRAIRIKPDLAEAHYNLGAALFQAGRYEDGIASYEKAIRLRHKLTDRGRAACLNLVGSGIDRAMVLLKGENTRGASKILEKIRRVYLDTKGDVDIHGVVGYALSNLLGRLSVQDKKMGDKILRRLRLPEVEKMLPEGRYLREIAILRDMLVAGYDPEKIILYGSCAAGDVSAGSDIDMLIIKEGVEGKDLVERKLEVMKLIGAINPGVRIEAVVHTSKELQDKLESSWFYRDEVIGKGWVIYEKRR
ncbi:MAG: tetratricopeptide repeat protein [Planctomycetota bacterium]